MTKWIQKEILISWLHFFFVGHFRSLHFEERHQERKR